MSNPLDKVRVLHTDPDPKAATPETSEAFPVKTGAKERAGALNITLNFRDASRK